MLTSSNRRRVGWAAALVAAALLLFPVQSLTVRPARGWGLHWAVPVSPGTAVVLTWVHTVSRRPVYERYLVSPEGWLRLDEMSFDHPGANLPAGPEQGTRWRIERDRWIVSGYDLTLERLDLGVAPYGHTLRAVGREFDLIAGVGADRLIRVAVEREPLLHILWVEVRQWRATKRT